MTLGTPIGSARMAAVAIEVPPLPAMPRIPPSRPASYSAVTTFASPHCIVSIASALSLPVRSSASGCRLLAPLRRAVMSGAKAGLTHDPEVHDHRLQAACPDQVADESEFLALRIQGAYQDDRFWHQNLLVDEAGDHHNGTKCTKAPSRSWLEFFRSL